MGRGPTQSYYRRLNDRFIKGTLTCLNFETMQQRVNTDFPLVLNIEPTNRCNLKCIYCPREKADKGIGMMNWEVFTRIIDEAAEYKKLLMLHLFKDGESFLHPRLIDMIRYAKKKETAETIRLNTNALCWNERTIDELLDSGLDDITVSLDAAWPETYKKHKGVDCLPLVEKQVRQFFEKRGRSGATTPLVRVKIMEFDEISKAEIEHFFDKWSGIADQVQVTGIHSWGGAIRNLMISDEVSIERHPCPILWYSLVVNWNREVTVCSVDWNTEIKVGRTNGQGLNHIWNSRAMKDVRRTHLEGRQGRYNACKQCVVWVPFGDLSEWLKSKKEFFNNE